MQQHFILHNSDSFRQYPSFRHYGHVNRNIIMKASQPKTHQGENISFQTQKWKGITHSSSPFVSHFIVPDDVGRDEKSEITVEEVITSILQHTSSYQCSSLPSSIVKPSTMVNVFNQDENQEIASALTKQNILDPRSIPFHRQLTSSELLALGSVWFSPVSTSNNVHQTKNKSVRLNISNANQILNSGDYLRVYHSPRRFPMIQNYDWATICNVNKTAHDVSNVNYDSKTSFSTSDSFSSLPLKGVIVAEDIELGYIIVNKPAGVPVHPTVDNELENVLSEISRVLLKRTQNVEQPVHCVDPKIRRNTQMNSSNYVPNNSSSLARVNKKTNNRNRKKKEPLIYVTTQQRLDQNTSGLFVVSTKKSFASYFAKLLSQKTEMQLSQKQMNNEKYDINNAHSGIHKKYKCLVCILSMKAVEEKASNLSLHDRVSTLRKYYRTGDVMTHYLKSSSNVPKTFVSQEQSLLSPHSSHINTSSWQECMLRIVDLGEVYSILGEENSKQRKLAIHLWGNESCIPKQCAGIVEVEVELLTGRTHQIRGQLSAEGFPLVGDGLYGGAIPHTVFVPHEYKGNYSNDNDVQGICRYYIIDNDGNKIEYKSQKNESNPRSYSEKLALQCCELSFLNLKTTKEETNETECNSKSLPNGFNERNDKKDRWSVFRLEEAWWSSHF